MYYKCLDLRPHGELDNQWASAPYPNRTPLRSPDTGGGGDPARGAGTKSGGNGEVEGRALDSMDNYTGRGSYLKARDHVTVLIDRLER